MMEAEKKARELIEACLSRSNNIQLWEAREITYVFIDEIISVLSESTDLESFNFWHKVKNEVEVLL